MKQKNLRNRIEDAPKSPFLAGLYYSNKCAVRHLMRIAPGFRGCEKTREKSLKGSNVKAQGKRSATLGYSSTAYTSQSAIDLKNLSNHAT